MKRSLHTGFAPGFASGFTLIELMVVITTIALLMTFLIPPMTTVMDAAEKTADRASLHKHFLQLRAYKHLKGHLPAQEGHKFVLAPWIEGRVERTEANRDRYFSAALGEDPHVIHLRAQDVDDIWPDFGSVSSRDTHFAGRAHGDRRHMDSGREIWMATDNEGGNTYRDGSVLMLYGDGVVKELTRDKQTKFGAPDDPREPFTMPVGPTSPHGDLRKLLR